ncbi:MAG: RraA family protein [Candidatus Melainabacteria bacterium]|nr:RraA family protein [Candidatus Melainabacteria bacterium]
MTKLAKEETAGKESALHALFHGLDTSSLCDSRKTLRVMSPQIRPLQPGTKILGVARTVSVLDDFLTVIKALHEAQAGEVLVIDGRGGERALLGELFSAEARRKGLAGIIVDGACRDSESIRAMGYPVFSRHVTPMAGTCNQLFGTQVSITCGGIAVEPGDIVFGDDDGVIVLSQSELDEIIDGARKLQSVEARILESLKRGTPLLDMTNAEEHLEAISAGKQSKLSFRVDDRTAFS